MGNNDFIVEIKANYNNFTKTEKKVADFILSNLDRVPFMGICELAQECGIGETSVFRFCKRMNLSGYQEFKMKLSLSRGDNLIRTTISGDIKVTDNVLDIADKILDSNIQCLKETRLLLDINHISSVVDMIIEAKRVFLYGVGSSSVTALDCMNKFLRITSKMIMLQDSHMQVMQSSMTTEDDLVIIFSYSGNTKDIIDVAKIVKDNGSKVVGITRYQKSELSKYLDILLLCSGVEDPMQGGSLSAKISQMYIINMLYTEYYKRTYNESKQNNKKTSESVMKKLN